MLPVCAQRGGTLENSGEMIGWELRELRVRVTKNNKISKSSQMRNKKIQREKPSKRKRETKITQISPGEGLSEGLRGTHGELRELSEGLRGTQGRTQGLRGLRPPILENSRGNSGGTSPRLEDSAIKAASLRSASGPALKVSH